MIQEPEQRRSAPATSTAVTASKRAVSQYKMMKETLQCADCLRFRKSGISCPRQHFRWTLQSEFAFFRLVSSSSSSSSSNKHRFNCKDSPDKFATCSPTDYATTRICRPSQTHQTAHVCHHARRLHRSCLYSAFALLL